MKKILLFANRLHIMLMRRSNEAFSSFSKSQFIATTALRMEPPDTELISFTCLLRPE